MRMPSTLEDALCLFISQALLCREFILCRFAAHTLLGTYVCSSCYSGLASLLPACQHVFSRTPPLPPQLTLPALPMAAAMVPSSSRSTGTTVRRLAWAGVSMP